jgi:hypothetical protein
MLDGRDVMMKPHEPRGLSSTTSDISFPSQQHSMDIDESANPSVHKDGRVNPTYTHKEAARRILSFIDSADFLMAYEQPSNDRQTFTSTWSMNADYFVYHGELSEEQRDSNYTNWISLRPDDGFSTQVWAIRCSSRQYAY